MPIYKYNGQTYDIPDNVVSDFEKKRPDATIAYQVDGNIYDIPLAKREGFLSKYPSASLYQEKVEQAKEIDPFQPESVAKPLYTDFSYQESVANQESGQYYPSPLNEEGRAETEPMSYEDRSRQEYEMLMRQLEEFDAVNGNMMDTYEAYEKAARHQINEGGFALDTMEREYLDANSGDYRARKQERDALNERIKNNSYFNQMRMAEADAANEAVDAISDLMAQNEAENTELHKKMKAMNALAMNPRGSFSGFSKTKEMQEYVDERDDLLTARRLYENTAQVYAAPINDGEDVLKKFGQGFVQRGDDLDFWTMGIVGIADDMNARAAFQKIQDKFGSVKELANLTDAEIDALLTPSEQLLISAVMDNNAALYARKDNTAGAYEAGAGAADSLMFMAQFLLTGGVGDAATVGTAAHRRLVNWLGRKVGSMSNGLMKDVARGTVKLGVGTAESIGKALVMTPLMPHTYANIADKLMSFDDKGELMDVTDAILTGAADALIETWSESTGDFVNKVLGVPGDITKGIAKKALKNVDFSDWGRMANAPIMKILRKGGFNGFLGEMGEEFIGNAVRSISGLEPDAFKEFTKLENLLVTAGSFAPMTIFGLGVSGAQYGWQKRQLDNAQKAFEAMLREASYTEDQARFVIDELLGSTDAHLTPEKLVANFSPLLRELAFNDKFANNRTQALNSAIDLMWQIARYRTFDGVYHRQEEQQRNDMLAEIQEGTGREFWTTRLSEQAGLDGTAYETDEVRAVEFKDGRVAYILGGDGVNNTVVYNDGQTGFLSEEQLNEGKANGSIVSDATMGLNDYLTQQVARVRMTEEEQRMFAERNTNIGQVRAQFPIDATVELGTTEAPIQGIVRQQTPNGVIVESPVGVSQLSWEELGHTIGIEVNPQTDAQMEEEAINNLEIADLQRRRERERRRAEKNAAAEAVLEEEQMVDEAVNEGLEKPIPMKADGTVDQTAFWNESPARWAQWKTEQRQDGGAYASTYIQNAIGILEGQIAESEAAFLAESDFDAKDALEQTINQQRTRLAELQDLAMQYMPSVIPAETSAETSTEQAPAAVMADRQKFELDAEYQRRLSLARALAEKEMILKEYFEAISAGSMEAVVMNKQNYKQVMKDNGCDEAAIEMVTNAIKFAEEENKAVDALHVNDKIFIVSEYITSIEGGRVSYVHERQHNITKNRPELIQRILSLGLDRETMQKIVKMLSGSEFYEKKSDEVLADEILSFTMEIAYTFDDFSVTLSKLGLPIELINLINEINDEQRKDFTLVNARRNSNALDSGQRDSGQNDGDSGQVSGGILGQEGVRPSEDSERGTEAGESGEPATGGAEATEEGLQVPVAEVEEESEEDTETILNEDGFEVDEQNEDVRFSVRYLPTPDQREGIIDSITQITGRTREEAERWLESELSLVPIVLNDKEYLDYAPDSKYKAIKDNSDYPQGTVDFNNICRKRKDFTRMYTRLQRAYPNRIFTAEDLADIRTIMSEDGLVVACGLCYVEDRRQKLGEVADEFIKDLQDGFKSYGKKNATKRVNAEKFRSFVGADTYVPSIYDLITLEGSDRLHDEHKGIWDAFGAYNRARGQQTQNTFQGYAEYKREILTWSDAKVKKVNSLGGLRIFSYSDFEAHHLLDIIQIIIDCAARGVMIQGYTKVPEFARVVEKTGIKLNRSLIPLGDTGIVDGRLAYDPVEGIDINDPNFLESNDNVGNILIGINDEQIRMAMADPFIHYIIPYHARQAGNIRAKLNVGAWTNYIDTQNERKKSDGKRVEKNINIYTDVLNESITNDREFVEKYLEVCREKGYIPKFDQFLDRDAEGNYVYTPGYYKFLVDFKLFDEAGNILPQKPVVAQFDDAFNAQVLLDYAREERETAGEAMNSTYDKIVETLDLGEPTVGEDVRFEASEGPIDLVEEAKKAQANDLMFRFIGEKAAQRLDAMVNATTMMDNLQIARDMEAQLNPDWSEKRNPAAMKIKMATGWERGVDGMWRKEMEDFEYKDMPKRVKKTYKLSGLIKDSSLFVEYPELKDIEVKFKKLPRNTNGQLIPVGNSFRIELSEDLYQKMNPDYIAAVDNFTNEDPDRMSRILNHTASPEEISDFLNAVGSIPPRLNEFGGRDTLAHEIQHAIQHIEGFAIGGNVNMVDARDSQVAPFFARLGQEMEEAQKLLDEYNDLQGQLVAARIVRDNVQIRYLTSSLTMVATQYKVHYQNIQTIQKLLRNFAPLGESGYHRLSGEVEARNVAERLDMSPEERRESLIADTQDVAHEDQIILRNYLMTDYAADTLVPGHVKGQPMLSDVEMLSDVSFRISNNTRRTIEGWCDKAGLAEDIKEGFIDHLEYTFDDTTEQLCAAKWYLNGTINLPNEDEYKVVGAVKVAKQNKVDPLLYYSPMDIFEKFGAPKEKLNPINPDKVSTLKNKTEVPGTDITIYDVEESEESRKNMREIINTHYGKNASPWCLLQGDAYGNLSENSAEYWERYSAYPKQVAFKNGRLLAFSANSSRVRTWWDRMDRPYDGVPVAEKLNDAKNRRCSVEIDPKTGKEIKRSNIYSLVEKDGYTIRRSWNEVDGPMISAQKLKDNQVVAQFNRFTRDDFANDVQYFFLGRPKGIDMVFTLEKSMMFYENGELESYSVEGFRAAYARNSRKAWTITTRESTIREFSFNRQGRLIEYFDGQRLIKDRKTLAQVEVPSEYMNIVRRDPKSFMAEAEQLLVETGLAEAYEESQEDIRFRVLDTTKAELKEKPIKLNGMYRFNLKNAFKGVKDNSGSYPYIKVQLEEVSDDYSGEKIEYDGILAGFAVIRIPKGLITEGEKDNVFFIDPKAIENELWDVLRATENYYEFKHGGAPYQRDWLNADNVRFRITPEQDKAYMDAVKAGDMETAQRMVIEAARLAMPNTKVVDENGNPRVVYHGSTAMFTVFDKSRIGSATGTADGRGFYFTTDRDYALGYKTPDGQLFEVFLNIEKPLSYDKKTITKAQLRKILKEADRVEYEQEGEHYMLSNYANYNDVGIDGAVNEGANLEYDYADNDVELVGSLIGGSGSFDIIMDAVKKVTGKSGMIAPKDNGTIHYVVIDPAGIKSAEPVTYDNDGNVIPLSQRFNPENEDIRFRISNNNQAIFVSNAARAVEGIKQEKATPEQWLKMIEKAGGLKAGEDKWMGLSDWLKASDKKTLTKQEVLDFINENMIQIEEVHYIEGSDEDFREAAEDTRYALQEIYDDYIAESEEMTDDIYMSTHYDYAIQKLAERLGYEAWNAPFVNINATIRLDLDSEFAAAELNDIRKRLGMASIREERTINETRRVYTTKGLTNLHEIALTVPTIESWNESDDIHFGDAGEGRAVAWIRFGETWEQRPSPQISRKVLVIDEIQSKRHQEGRDKGYRSPASKRLLEEANALSKQLAEFEDELRAKYKIKGAYSTYELMPAVERKGSEEDYERYIALNNERNAKYAEYEKSIEGVDRNAPFDAPFDKNWHELAMKRMLRYAAENGYDVIAWTTGDQQASRYDLSKMVKKISVYPSKDGSRSVNLHLVDRENDFKNLVVDSEGMVTFGEYKGRALADVVGKDYSMKIMAATRNTEFSGDNLQVGGEGMRGFYDKMLPAFMNKYGKRWGVKVEDINLPNLGRYGYTMHSIPVTEEMKASVMEGQVMFRMRGENESAEEFFESAVSDYKAKYTELGTLMALPVDDITAKRFGYTLEQLQKINGLYEPGTDIIAIFAHERIEDTILIENTIFHEDIHYIASFYPHMDKLGKWLMENADMVKAFAEIRDEVETYYEESKRPQEMLCRIVSLAMTTGTTSELDMVVPYELQNIVRQIENEIGYDRGTEESSRKAQWLAQHTGSEEGSEPSAREHPDGRRSDEETRFRTTEITPEVRDEMAVIAATALVNGNYMKAPNGADTNLTAEQWAMVRTENFKAWFGDWENDPENASKVVDENGEPMVVYHGTQSKFTAFDVGYKGKNFGFRLSDGFYFSPDETVAESYASFPDELKTGEVKAVFLNIINPFYIKSAKDYREQIKEIASLAAQGNRYQADLVAGMSESELLSQKGYDGVVEKRTDEVTGEIVVFDPNQIKSATDNTGEFSVYYDIRFSIRTKPAPEKIGIGYKVFYLKDGKLYPPMVANLGGVDTPVGVWLDAEEGTRAGVSKTGRPQVKQGGKGTQGGSGTLAYRPGWHLGEIPYAIQFNRKDENGNRTLFPADFVWAEVEYANDVDYQEEAMSYGMNANGKFQHSLAGLPKLPTDGSYRYRTNPNPETDPWIITGAMKVNRLLTPSEVDQMVIDAGREPQKRQEGAVTDAQIEALNKDLGLVEEEEEVSFRTTGTPTEDVVAEGVSLSPAQLASLAGDIFAALPEESRKKITDGLNGNILGLQDAILQIPTSLATKEEWNDEDRQMAEVVAEQMTKAVGIEMTRPFSASEALWTLYNAVNKSTDLVSEASRALVRRNLGFDSQTLEMEKEAKDGVRFRTVGNASANAQASMYNRGAVNVWTRLKEVYVDMHASVEKLVKAIEKKSGKVAEGFENILMALNQQSSKGLAAMEAYEQKFLNKMFDEIREIMDKTDFKYEDIVRYVILKHGLERNIKLAQRDAMAHYQEIYDDIIAKIKGMNPAQKRTYLTNAQLRDADAKAELAVLQGVNTSALTPDQLRDHKKALAKAKKEAAEAAEHLVRAQKIATMTEQDAQAELDKIFKKIEKGTDSVYKEMRKNDYSGISSMFYDTLGVDRKNYATEEEYQAALMQAKADKYDNLGDIEGAAQMEVTLFENAVNTDKLWKSINKATKETLRQQYEANMISKDQYENLRNMFEFYVPLRGFADNTAEDMYTYYRRPNSTGYTKPILGAEGRKTEAESPFGWIAAMAGSAIASNVKNEAKLALYYFVANRPDNGIATLSKTWFVHTPGDVDANGKKIFRPAYPSFNQDLSTDAAKQAYEDWQEQMRDLQKQGLAYEAGQRLNLGNSVVNISDTNKPEHIVNVKVGGKDYTIVINGNPRAAQAINGDLNIETNETYNNVLLGPWLRWLSSVNTSYNPEFWATNMMRDMAFTLMAVNIKGDPAYRRKFFKNYAKAFKVISMVIKNEKGTLGNSYIERMYKDFVKYGGVTGFTQIKDSETWEKEIEKYLKNQDADTTKAIKAVKDGLHAMHRFGESLEQVSRFAAFLTSVETGKSINEAINDAKEITVNFNRKGSGKRITLKEAKTLTKNNGQPLNDIEAAIVSGISHLAPAARSTIMFFNASVQALNAWFKLWKANKLRSLSWVAGYAALGVMNALIHALLDDDDDYLDMPQYERRSSLMLGGNGVYFKWALPQEMSAFYALGELSVETIFGRNPHQSAAAEAAKVMGDMLPVNIAKIIIEKDGWVEAIPSQVKPFLELVRNEDYKGDVIFNEQKWLSEGERERTANWESAYKGTGRPYIEISKLLNNLTDSKDLDEAGWINIHPESLEHVVESMTGGVGRTVSKLFNFITAAINPEEDVTVRQSPFLNRILTINDERYKNVHVNDVYDYYAAEAEHALTLKKKYEKDKDKDSYNKLLKSDEYKWATIYSRYKKTIKQYQEKIKAAEGTKERMELMKQQDELKRKMIKEISDL